MKAWGRYVVGVLAGVAVGIGGAVWSVRVSGFGSNEAIGPWRTGRDFGTAHASAHTRAVVALYGLLALPAKEARYYTAATDDDGNPLVGNCRYRVTGGVMPTRWWSVTLYDPDGYLIPNPANVYSISSLGLPATQQAAWALTVAPEAPAGDGASHWLPSGGPGRFALTLRTYLPADRGRTNLTAAQLPHIVKESC